jgi:MinD-like ATPase involved in chromosome partitioning or flagellar assembly
MRGVRIPHDLNGEDQFVLGLSVPRLAALLLGLLAAYTILHLSLPAPLQLTAAALAALIGAAVAWVRPEGRSLIHWALAAIEFKFGERDSSHRVEAADGGVPSHVLRNQVPTREFPLAESSGVGASRVAAAATAAGKPSLQVLSTMAPAAPAPTTATAAAFAGDDVIELPDEPARAVVHSGDHQDPESAAPAPVYLGGPQVITFFSAKGGTGRTTLATEVAALLALKGNYRDSAAGAPQRLRVALIDFDLASANVSARLGLAQPTMLDYLCDSSVQHPDPRDFVIHHQATNVDVLLGPSKCLAGDRADLIGVAQAAHILSTLKGTGYHFLVLDISANIGDLETYLLEAATRIYCVVTPTAGSVQSLYRGVEALRRLGLGAKLHYVANKMRDGVSLNEPMGDLNGSLVARIPYDAAFDIAENRHQPMALGGGGPTVDALMQLASSIYPALLIPITQRSGMARFAWFGKRRRAG